MIIAFDVATMKTMNDHIITRPQPAPVRLLLKPKEAALALSICERTLATIVQRGEIPIIRVPDRGLQARAIRYAVDDLRAWIEKQKAAAEAEKDINPQAPTITR